MSDNPFNMKDKVVLVTGGATGIEYVVDGGFTAM